MTDRFPGVRFGIFAVVCLIAAGYVMSVTGNYGRSALPFVGDEATYQAVLDDVSGLFVGDDVKLAGVSIGRVQEIRIERGNAVVTFRVNDDVEIRDTWEVGARWRNVIGQRYLYLYEGQGGDVLEPGSTIPVERSRPVANISRFFNEITPLLDAIDAEQQNKLLDALNTALVGREQTVQELVTDLGSLSGTLAAEEPEIRGVLDNGAALLDEYNRRDAELQAFLTELAATGDTLAARNDELIGAITDIGQVQQQFGDLLRANDAEIDSILDNMEVATATIGSDRAEFEQSVATLRDGLAVYMLISRWGQWFNVRAVAIQAQDDGELIFCRTEGNAPCSDLNSDGTNTDGRPGGGGAATSRMPARESVVTAVLTQALGSGAER